MTDTQRFLAAAHRESSLGTRVRACRTFREIAAVAYAHGFRRREAELRSAFAERNAAVLAAEMFRQGLIDLPIDAPNTPWDQELWSRIESLDLEFVYKQLTNRKGWEPERARQVEAKYRRFLYLCIAESFPTVPEEDVDEFWHQHILNTQEYAAQTQSIAGKFLHHAPSSGEPEGGEELSNWFEMTVVTYERTFREPYVETAGEALLNRYPAPVDIAAAA